MMIPVKDIKCVVPATEDKFIKIAVSLAKPLCVVCDEHCCSVSCEKLDILIVSMITGARMNLPLNGKDVEWLTPMNLTPKITEELSNFVYRTTSIKNQGDIR